MPQIRAFYNEKTQEVIVKKPPDDAQATLRESFAQDMSYKISDMDLPREYASSGRTNWDFHVNGERVFRMDADDSYGPRLVLPGGQRQRRSMPTIVLERGYMDFLERYCHEAKWWLVVSKGGIKVAFVLAHERNKPVIAIEEWRLAESNEKNKDENPPAEKYTPVRTQTVNMILSEDGEIEIIGAPSTIRFYDIFLRDLNLTRPKEGDVVLTEKELEEIAKMQWEGEYIEGPFLV